MCPYHKHLCYGEGQEFYDTTRLFFDCGTVVYSGYSYYKAPKQYSHIVIFKDQMGYTTWCPRAGWTMLACQVSLEQARRVARARLKTGGHIIERF